MKPETLLAVTHNIVLARSISDRIVFMSMSILKGLCESITENVNLSGDTVIRMSIRQNKV